MKVELTFFNDEVNEYELPEHAGHRLLIQKYEGKWYWSVLTERDPHGLAPPEGPFANANEALFAATK